MSELVTIAAASVLCGLSPSALRGLCHRGKLVAVKQTDPRCNRSVWMIDPASLPGLKARPARLTYQQLVEDWLHTLATGKQGGRPMAAITLKTRRQHLGYLWRHARLTPSLNALSPATFTLAVSNLPPDHDARRCNFAVKEQIWKSLSSFGKYLAMKGYWTDETLLAIKRLKPKRLYPPRRTVLNRTQVAQLLAVANQPGDGYDAQLSAALVAALLYTGLRLNEMVTLTMGDVDWDHGMIRVLGKGAKLGYVPIPGRLSPILKHYVSTVRPDTMDPHVFVQANGKPLTRRGLQRRVKALADKAGLDVTVHGLRRTCATLMVDDGAPIVYAQRILRHSSVKTTEGYVLPDAQTVTAWMHNW